MLLRLQQYLAQRGVASRRKAEEIIAAGRVTIGGAVAKVGDKIDDERDEVCLDGAPLPFREKKVYIMLHKPEGYVTTAEDQFGRKTVLDLIDRSDVPERIYPVGRLDFDTSGLLLLTNDGDLTLRLTHPSHEVEKTYIARLFGRPTDDELRLFRDGIEIDGRMTAPAKITVVKEDGRFCSVKIQIHEGRNRQVRNMCEAIGHKVAVLKRVATGGLFLGDLRKGEYRRLTAKEVETIRQASN